MNFKNFTSLHAMKDGGDRLLKALDYVFRHMDKSKFEKFRAGTLSLSQIISQIEREKPGGLDYKVYDDVKDGFTKNAFRKPTNPAIVKAH